VKTGKAVGSNPIGSTEFFVEILFASLEMASLPCAYNVYMRILLFSGKAEWERPAWLPPPASGSQRWATAPW